MSDWLVNISSVVIGSIMTIASSWLADSRLSRRERERRNDEQRALVTMKRNEFQRETLLNLQTQSQKYARNISLSLHHDKMNHNQTDQWQHSLLPEGLSDDILRTKTEIILQASRIHDARTRELAEHLREAGLGVSLSKNKADAGFHFVEMIEVQKSLIDHTGKIIRELDQT